MTKLKWLKGMESLFITHEYFITKSINETTHSRNIFSARIKDTLLPSAKPNLPDHSFNQKYECLRQPSKNKKDNVKRSVEYRECPLTPTLYSKDK